jgi:hypothetical protein
MAATSPDPDLTAAVLDTLATIEDRLAVVLDAVAALEERLAALDVDALTKRVVDGLEARFEVVPDEQGA